MFLRKHPMVQIHTQYCDELQTKSVQSDCLYVILCRNKKKI